MTGWEKVIAATALAVIGLAALNLAIWRRLRAVSAVQIEDEQERFVQPLEIAPVEHAGHTIDVSETHAG